MLDYKKFLWPLFFIALLIFTLLSGYTTMLGVSMVLPYEDDSLRKVISFLFALAAGIMMYGINLMLKFEVTEKRRMALFVYLILLCISIFFNFNAMHGVMEKRLGFKADALQLREEYIALQADAVRSVAEKFRLSELEEAGDDLRARMAREEYHSERPGQGPLYAQLERQLLALEEGDLAQARRRVESFESKIRPLINTQIVSIDTALKDDSTAVYEETFEQGRKVYPEILAVIHNELPDYDRVFTFTSSAERVDRPERAVLAFREYVFGDDDNPMASSDPHQIQTEKDKEVRIGIALAMSFVIDMPLLLFMIILSMPNTKYGTLARLRDVILRRIAQGNRQRKVSAKGNDDSIWGD